MRSWRRDLEVPRRVVGLLQKVQLCLKSYLTKERCVGVYLFVRWFIQFRRRSGWLNTALYLKASGTCLMRYYGGDFDRHLARTFPVSLTRSGIPRCIPSFHRRLISRRDERSDKLVKFYLSLLILFIKVNLS